MKMMKNRKNNSLVQILFIWPLQVRCYTGQELLISSTKKMTRTTVLRHF